MALNEVIEASDDNEIVIDVREIFFRLKQRWKFIASITFVATLLMGIYSFVLLTPRYESSAMIYIKSSGLGSTTSELLQGIQIGEQLAPDYELLFTSRPVVTRVIDSLNLDTTVERLNQTVEISNPTDTHMIILTVTNEDAQLAADIADAYIEYGIDVIREVNVTVPYIVEDAIAENKPVWPNHTINLLVGFGVGLVVSCGIVIVQAILNDKLKGKKAIEDALGYPVLTIVYDDTSLSLQQKRKQSHTRNNNHKSKEGSMAS